MAATFLRRHFEAMVEGIVHRYLQGNHQKPGFLRWCRVWSIHCGRLRYPLRHRRSETYDSLPNSKYQQTNLGFPSVSKWCEMDFVHPQYGKFATCGLPSEGN